MIDLMTTESSVKYRNGSRRSICSTGRILCGVVLTIAFTIAYLFLKNRAGNNAIGDVIRLNIQDFQLGSTHPEVRIKNGRIQGKMCGGARCFLGIPFAQPPLGPLRFKHPVPPKEFEGTLETKYWRKGCMEAFYSSGNSEDCLYLNVIAPIESSSNAKHPVLVYIHGGAYLFGNSRLDELGVAEGFASKNIIVVSISYRLAVFGFFTSENGDFPPNAGLADQITALRWVHEEIEAFQGDPSRVTIAGHSAGAFSVSLLTLSPAAQPYFQQAMMLSGTAFCPWAAYGNQHQFPKGSRAVAVATGCISGSDWNAKKLDEFKTCIANLDTEKISTKTSEAVREIFPMPWNPTTFGMNWAPRLDGTNGLLPGNSLLQLSRRRKKHMPVILGTTRDENFRWTLRSPPGVLTAEGFNKTVRVYGSEDIWGSAAKEIQQILFQHYTPQDKNNWFNPTLELLSDRDFNSGAVREAENLLDTTSNVYAYSFDFDSLSTSVDLPNGDKVKGVNHVEDLKYIFTRKSAQIEPIQDLLWRIWSNFIISGNPNTPEALPQMWKAFEKYEKSYYSISLQPRSKTRFHDRPNKIWNEEILSVYEAKQPN